MAIFYSVTTNGFYDTEIGYNSLPEDAIEITTSEHINLLEGINHNNKEVYVDNGQLKLRDKIVVITWSQIRDKRNYLLTQSDYTQISDYPGDKVAWGTYRQDLRDIPQTYATPADVVWPTKPST